MRSLAGWVLLLCLFGVGPLAAVAASSDEEIKQQIIRASIASYPGNCPCPYNLAANGSRCGKRSAWSKAGGYEPICFPEEITPSMIEQWRKQNGA